MGNFGSNASSDAEPVAPDVSDDSVGADLKKFNDAAFESLLASMPPEYRDQLIRERDAEREARAPPPPPDDDDEAAPAVEYARVASAPLAASFRGEPVVVEVRGLASEKGRGLNGRKGWAVKTSGDRVKVLYRDGAA